MLTPEDRRECWGWTFLSIMHNFLFDLEIAAESLSSKMMSDMKVHIKQRCVLWIFPCRKIGIHLCLLTIYGDQTMGVSIVKKCVFCSGDNNACDKPCSKCGMSTCWILFIVEENEYSTMLLHSQYLEQISWK